MRPALAAVALAALAAGVAAQDKAADKYTSKEGRYAVAFPGTPTTSTTKAKDTALNVAKVGKDGGEFLVIYADLPAAAVKAAKAKELLEGSEAGLVKNLGAKLTNSKEVEFGKAKHPAREIVAEKDDPKGAVTVRVLLVLADNRLYQVLAVGPKAMATGKDADKFFESFEVAK